MYYITIAIALFLISSNELFFALTFFEKSFIRHTLIIKYTSMYPFFCWGLIVIASFTHFSVWLKRIPTSFDISLYTRATEWTT